MANLTSTEARTIAESIWGRGGTFQEKTNRKGVFYFHCSGHGGYVASWNAFTPEEQAALMPYVGQPEIATRAKYRGRNVLCHPYMTRGKRYNGGTEQAVPFMLFEEDCAWAYVPHLTGVNLVLKPASAAQAYETFHRWLDPESPEVKARQEESDWRNNGHADLIVSALSVTGQKGVCRVVTADGLHHIVTGYQGCRDGYERPLLSLCERSTPVAGSSIYDVPSADELAALVA